MGTNAQRITPPIARSVQLAQATTMPWGQLGISGESARGLGVPNPRGVAPALPPEPVPRIARLVRWVGLGLTIADVLRTIVGPAPVLVTEIAIGDRQDLSIRIYGKSYNGPEAGTAMFVRGLNGPPLGVSATVTNEGLRFDAAALERAYGKPLPPPLAHAAIAVADDPGISERRISNVHENLSTDGAYARALLASQARFAVWQAHHLIPFAAVANLPRESQLAIARAGWKMDSPENLVVLPGDEQSYQGAPNFEELPLHRGPHPNYNLEVASRLSHLKEAAPALAARDVRTEMAHIEEAMFRQLLDRRRGYHPRVSLNQTQTRGFG